MTSVWGSDAMPSRPEPLRRPALVDLGGSGFVFTSAGIAHNVTQDVIEEMMTPTFAPLLSGSHG